MKKYYLLLLLGGMLLPSLSNAQSATKTYDHDAPDLRQLFTMPFDQSRILVVADFYDGHQYYDYDQQNNQLIALTFNDVDTIRSQPKIHENKIFFSADVNGLGHEVAAFDGTSTHLFDFNLGTNGSNPELFTFEDELFVIADNGATRQLYKYEGGTSFQQLTDDTLDQVNNFVASKGNEYYYTTLNSFMVKRLKKTADNNGTLTHNTLQILNIYAEIKEAVFVLDELYCLFSTELSTETLHGVKRIDSTGNQIGGHGENGALGSTGHMFVYDQEVYFYKTEPGEGTVTNVTTSGTGTGYEVSPTSYSAILGHVVQNGQLFLYGKDYILNMSSGFVLLSSNSGVIQSEPAFKTNGAFYLYEIDTIGQSSGIIEVDSYFSQLPINSGYIKYEVTTQGESMPINHPMIKHNGGFTFLFTNTEGILSTDIYSFSTLLANHQEIEVNDVEVYPNPISQGQVLNVNSRNQTYFEICGLDGKVVSDGILKAGENHIATVNLPVGHYLVRTESQTVKFVVLP